MRNVAMSFILAFFACRAFCGEVALTNGNRIEGDVFLNKAATHYMIFLGDVPDAILVPKALVKSVTDLLDLPTPKPEITKPSPAPKQQSMSSKFRQVSKTPRSSAPKDASENDAESDPIVYLSRGLYHADPGCKDLDRHHFKMRRSMARGGGRPCPRCNP